ncbi:hypothetical protein [Ascidiaceihabitans sp.]|uniref:hypothetical protein n=1 Tax=Ascidiaceihabitans sp. TaxID=1872644 RepID=UPI003299C0B5
MQGLKAAVVAFWMGAAVAAQAQSTLVAEDQTPTGKFTTATEVKPILNVTRGNWIAVREWDGQDLVYVTHLWAWRCGLAQIEVSVNDAGFAVWPMPACHTGTAQPNSVTDSDGLPYAVFARQSVANLSVRVTYDDLTVDEARFERGAILIP